MQVRIKAIPVLAHADGTITLEIESRPLSPEDEATLARLFPNVGEAAETLLENEALIQARRPYIFGQTDKAEAIIMPRISSAKPSHRYESPPS